MPDIRLGNKPSAYKKYLLMQVRFWEYLPENGSSFTSSGAGDLYNSLALEEQIDREGFAVILSRCYELPDCIKPNT